MTLKAPLLHLAYAFALLLAISGCSPSNDNNQSYIQFSNPANAFKQKSMARSDEAPAINSLIITIKDTDDNQISNAETINSESLIKLSVPSNVSLIVSGSASINGIETYFGETTIAPLLPGAVSSLSLLLYNITSESTPISVEFPSEQSAEQSTLLSKSSGTSFSRNDNFVLFFSDDSTLASNEKTNLFIRNFSDTNESNIVTNLHTSSASVEATGGDVIDADISADGVYVVFSSTATNLVLNDTNEAADIFLKNTITGEIQRLSLPETSNSTTGLNSYNPQISDDGSIVTFFSEATLTGDASNTVFIFNTIKQQVLPISISNISDNYRLSGDGSSIVYQVKNQSENGLMQSAFTDPTTTSALSKIIPQSIETSTSIDQINLSDANYTFSVNQNGEYTAFILDSDAGGLLKNQIYLYTSSTKKLLFLTKTRGNLPFDGALTQSGPPSLSNDGRYVVFSYDDVTYVRSIQYNNLLEVGTGSNPFISASGDKIGYEVEGKLFIIDNPLYLPTSVVVQKASAPASFSFIETKNGLDLSWDAIAGASYYRVYQSIQGDISNNLENPSFTLFAYETNEILFSLDPFLASYELYQAKNPAFYFVVYAINENGEGIASEELKYQKTIPEPEVPVIPDTPVIPPTLSITSNIENTNFISVYQKIQLTFSEEIDINSLLSAISITDSSDLSVAYNIDKRTGTSATISLKPSSTEFSEDETYTLTINQNLTTAADELLATDYAINFKIGFYFNEGNIEVPLPITSNYVGVAAANGNSFYSLPLPASNLANRTFAVKLIYDSLLASPILSINNSQSKTSNCTTNQVCIIENITSASAINITVNNSNIYSGTAYTIILTEVNVIDASNALLSPSYNALSFSIAMGKSYGYVLIKNLKPDFKFHLTDLTNVFNYDRYDIKTLYPANSVDDSCRITIGDGEDTQCQFASTPETGNILLEFDSSIGTRFNNETRDYQLDVVYDFAYPKMNGYVFGEKFFNITGLKANTGYQLDLNIGTGNRAYTVSSNVNFTYPECSGQLNNTTNTTASCLFNLFSDGPIYIKFDDWSDVDSAGEGHSVSLMLSEISQTLSLSSSIQSTNFISVYQKIQLTFSEEIDTATLLSAISITDSSASAMAYNIDKLTTTSATITLDLGATAYSTDETYTLAIDQSLTTAAGELLSAAYTTDFMIGFYFNEGSVGAPLIVSDNYAGVVNAGGNSFYSLPLPVSNLASRTFIVRLIYDNLLTTPSLTINNNVGELVDCGPRQICIIENITSASAINITINNANTISGIAYAIFLTEVNVIDATNALLLPNYNTLNFSAAMGENYGYTLIKNLATDLKFHLTDSTSIFNSDSYGIDTLYTTYNIDDLCSITLGDSGETQCQFTSTPESGEILLEFDSTAGTRFNNEIRDYQLDLVNSSAYIPQARYLVYGEKFFNITGLMAYTDYKLDLILGVDSRAYVVSSNVNFISPICSGQLDDTTTTIAASCMFSLSTNDSIYIKFDEWPNAGGEVPSVELMLTGQNPEIQLP